MRINKNEIRDLTFQSQYNSIFLEKRQLAYDPNRLLDWLLTLKKLRSDAALSRCLQVTPPVISKIRSGQLNLSPNLLLKIHDAYNIPINELRALLGNGTSVALAA